MLQRVQTIFLLLVIGAVVAMLFMPIWSETSADGVDTISLTAFDMTHIQTAPAATNATQTFYIAIFAILAAAHAAYSIFRYDNRLLQMKIGLLITIQLIATVAFTLNYILTSEDIVNPKEQGDYRIGFFLLVFALLFNSMANRFIRKDENLVRSVDRLR